MGKKIYENLHHPSFFKSEFSLSKCSFEGDQDYEPLVILCL